MAFELYKGNANGTVEMVPFTASAAVAAGDVVKLVAAGSAGGPVQVAPITGGAGGTDYSYGVAAHAAAVGDTVLVTPHESGQVWSADAAANCDMTKAGDKATYIDASMKVATDGTISNNGNRVIIVGMLGDVTKKKYLVRFVPSTALVI